MKLEYRTIQLALLPRPDQTSSQKYELAGTGFFKKAGARLTEARKFFTFASIISPETICVHDSTERYEGDVRGWVEG
jgi:hypothetical protein